MSRSNYRNKSGLVGAIAVMLVVVMITVALGFLTSGFKNWNAGTWFKKDETTPAETNENFVFDGDGKAMESGKVHAMPKNMLFSADIAAVSAASVMIQATVKPDFADNKSVDWSVSWVSPSSTWATGKTITEYLTITPQSDGSTTAEVSCLQAFGEKIKITVTSRQNEYANAACTVDYASRIASAGVDIYTNILSGQPVVVESNFYHSVSASDTSHMLGSLPKVFSDGQEHPVFITFDLMPNYSAYTLKDNFSFKTSFTYSPAFLNALTAQGINLKSGASNAREFLDTSEIIAGSSFVYGLEDPLFFGSFAIEFIDGLDEFIFSFGVGETYNKFIAAAKTVGLNSFGTLKIEAMGQYSSFTRNLDIKIDPAMFVYGVESVELDNGILVI